MAKFYGLIGFGFNEETAPGVWEESITERKYSGDLNRNSRKVQTSDKVNDDISVSNEISIVADSFANNNFYSMKYVKFMGAAWKITNVEVQHPRLILTIGGLYNVK